MTSALPPQRPGPCRAFADGGAATGRIRAAGEDCRWAAFRSCRWCRFRIAHSCGGRASCVFRAFVYCFRCQCYCRSCRSCSARSNGLRSRFATAYCFGPRWTACSAGSGPGCSGLNRCSRTAPKQRERRPPQKPSLEKFVSYISRTGASGPRPHLHKKPLPVRPVASVVRHVPQKMKTPNNVFVRSCDGEIACVVSMNGAALTLLVRCLVGTAERWKKRTAGTGTGAIPPKEVRFLPFRVLAGKSHFAQ